MRCFPGLFPVCVLLEARNKTPRLVDRALGSDLSSMPVYDALNGRQSYSSAFELFSQVQTLKYAEKLIDIPHVKACAVVSDEQLRLIFPTVDRSNLDLGPFSYPRELNRIGKQVHKDDFQHGAVPVTNRKRPDIPSDLPILRLLP